jgi:hypothetical protein
VQELARKDFSWALVIGFRATGSLDWAAHHSMQGEIKERWYTLCEQAAIEQDPERLMALIEEINQLLGEKEQRLQQRRAEGTNAA